MIFDDFGDPLGDPLAPLGHSWPPFWRRVREHLALYCFLDVLGDPGMDLGGIVDGLGSYF